MNISGCINELCLSTVSSFHPPIQTKRHRLLRPTDSTQSQHSPFPLRPLAISYFSRVSTSFCFNLLSTPSFTQLRFNLAIHSIVASFLFFQCSSLIRSTQILVQSSSTSPSLIITVRFLLCQLHLLLSFTSYFQPSRSTANTFSVRSR
ncbi:unnamed protein product [Vicia faba]|uniref:Uncharacterized protein n=1 Tax=Vicia faba TaxID=3906 RepID=A0AAV1AXI8_VICFA|nr:unnamed protein product [Vicia faba]